MTVPNRRVTLLVCLVAVLPRPLAPATIEVGETCTLVDAITAANSDATVGGCPAGSGADSIVLSGAVTLDSVDNNDDDDGPNGLPVVTSEITIEGGGHSIARDPLGPDFRILKVDTVGALTLVNATIRYGIGEPYATFDGGGGGILSRGSLTLLGSTISDSRAGWSGGGVWSSGDAYLYNSTISSNIAPNGGGITNLGVMEILQSSIYENFAYAYTGGGGGIGNHSDADLTISRSVVRNNSATGEYGVGGAISSSGELIVFNSTLASNGAAYGGAIVGDVTMLSNSTLYANRSNPGLGYSSAVLLGNVTLYNTILDNHDDDTHNCSTFAADLGNNFADDPSCGFPPSMGIRVDPELRDNGGPTWTHALLEGSVAIDSGGDCSAATDQRGALRDDGACDSGAFEVTDCIAPQGRELVLVGGTTTTEETFETCLSITVSDYSVLGPEGHMILRTAGFVSLGDGFGVDPDGRLTVEIDGSILVPAVEAAAVEQPRLDPP